MADKPKDEAKTPEPTPAPLAAPPEVHFTPSPALEEHVTTARMKAGLKCPQCGGPTEPYEGLNPHKQGTYECPDCRLRVPGRPSA